MNENYADTEPLRPDIDRLQGPALLEFGSPFCGHCLRTQPLLAEALVRHTGMQHIRIIDGPGRPLGRSFGVKLWPTLVFLADGVEAARLVRPQTSAQIVDALRLIDIGD